MDRVKERDKYHRRLMLRLIMIGGRNLDKGKGKDKDKEKEDSREYNSNINIKNK